MTRTIVSAFAVLVAASAWGQGQLAPTSAAQADPLASHELAKRTVHRRAVEAAIWGQPALTFDAIRQAYFREGKAKYNDVVWWPKGADWKNQTLTPNTSLRYVYAFCNTGIDGPVVLELPGSAGGASFFGTIEDAWFVPLADMGGDGEDKGKGGKYLVLPPDYKGDVPPGYIAVRPRTYNVMLFLRSIVASYAEADVRAGDDLVRQIRVYPLGQAADPPRQRLLDMSGILFEGLVRYDESLYASLARMLNEEPVHPRDLQMMGMLLSLDIEKGKEFKPDAATTMQLQSAAQEAQAWVIDGLARTSPRFWPDRKWAIPTPPISAATLFKWEVASYFDTDSRAIALASYYSPPVKLGASSFYLGVFVDALGQPLQGENTYRLRVPANAPVRQFWALTVYSKETAALFRDSSRVTLGSLDTGLKKNADGSVDIYIGPKAPRGQDSNWLYTPAGKGWWPWFRFYGPEKALLDKTASWKLPDFEWIK